MVIIKKKNHIMVNRLDNEEYASIVYQILEDESPYVRYIHINPEGIEYETITTKW